MNEGMKTQLVINWHLMEECNYRCKYCYAEWKAPKPMLREVYKDQKSSNKLLAEIASFGGEDSPVRLTFAGGEPMLDNGICHKMSEAKRLGIDLSIITNASVNFDRLVSKCATELSWLGISLDAEAANVNKLIQRASRTGKVLDTERLKKGIEVARWHNPDLKVKINTVVNRYNYREDLNAFISGFAPDKWKILRVLPASPRSAEEAITDEQFAEFCERHKHLKFAIFEDNEGMLNSYIMIDPYGRFFFNGPGGEPDGGTNCVTNGYRYSDPIIEVGIHKAFEQVDFERERFDSRYK